MSARGRGALGLAAAALACACAVPAPDVADMPAPGGAVPAWELRERVRRVEPGQPRDAALAILGRDPVERPGHPDAPFASPWRELALVARDGSRARVELYVVEAFPAEGCPDVALRTAPVAFAGDTVAAVGWADVEARWRAWGGTLEALRDARDTTECLAPAPSPDTGAEPPA